MLHDALARGRVTAGGEYHPVPGGMIETAENLRREYAIAREEQDEFAVRSHFFQRASAAQAGGRFADEIVPVTVKGRKGDVVVDRDEHIRPDSTVETLAKLGVMGKQDVERHGDGRQRLRAERRPRSALVTSPARPWSSGLRPLGQARVVGRGRRRAETMGIGRCPPWRSALGSADSRSRTST